MKKTLLTASVLLILVAGLFILTGCGDDTSKGIVGSWAYQGDSYIYKFNTDNTGSYTMIGSERKFTYEDDGTKVKITYDGDTTGSTYEYTIEGNKLLIKDSFGSTVEYTKK